MSEIVNKFVDNIDDTNLEKANVDVISLIEQMMLSRQEVNMITTLLRTALAKRNIQLDIFSSH